MCKKKQKIKQDDISTILLYFNQSKFYTHEDK